MALLVLIALLASSPVLAQARSPFGVGISEGGGSASGLTGWLLAQQGWLEHELSLGVRAARSGGWAAWPLIGMSFVYGVFHAAGPGHGKAVLASYMVANERALRRGIALSLAAALLQGCVAILLVAVMTLALHATASRMRVTASLVETGSFVAIVLLGLGLVWRKGSALRRAWIASRVRWPRSGGAAALFDPPAGLALANVGGMALRTARPFEASRFACDPADAAHAADCLHCHGPDPRMLKDERIDWREVSATVLAAGSRPCSGAILVLVFAVSQGVFGTGMLSVLAMSAGVALTTAALAIVAVAFKATAAKLAGPGSGRALLAGAAIEFLAAGGVLLAGSLLLAGYAGGIGGS